MRPSQLLEADPLGARLAIWDSRRMTQTIKAATAYFAIVFGIGFVLGTARVLAIIPRIGEPAAVLLEVPVMLATSWFAARWCIARFAVARNAVPRLAMGFTAFALVMVAELVLFGRTPAQHFAAYRHMTAGLGLAAQLAFALFPRLQRPRNAGKL